MGALGAARGCDSRSGHHNIWWVRNIVAFGPERVDITLRASATSLRHQSRVLTPFSTSEQHTPRASSSPRKPRITISVLTFIWRRQRRH